MPQMGRVPQGKGVAMLSNRRPMIEPEFAAFLRAREERWELIGGEPVMMAPTTQRHANIVANILATLHRQLRGTRCRPTYSKTGVRTGAGTIRFPDLVVDCGPREDQAMCATAPVLACEVLSPSHDLFDTHLRVSEYRAVTNIACILLVDPDVPRAIAHLRDGSEWRDHFHAGLDQVVTLQEIGAALVLGDVYDGCEFDHPEIKIWGRPC